MNLSTLQTQNHRFTIAAFDHRSSLAETLGIDVNSEEGKKQFIQLKQLFMETYSPFCSAVLTDPIFGKETVQYRDAHAGLLMSLEESGYEGGKEVVPPMMPDWGVLGIKGYGASAKLLLYFHPDEKNADAKLDLVKQIYAQCEEHEVPFLLEPVLFPVEEKEEFEQNWEKIQQRTVEMFDSYCHVLKIEYPGLYAKSEQEAEQACAMISQFASTPWIILSRGMDYEHFKTAVEISINHGGAGFAVGRGVWQEIDQWSLSKTHDWDYSFDQISEFLHTTGTQRMKELIDLVV